MLHHPILKSQYSLNDSSARFPLGVSGLGISPSRTSLRFLAEESRVDRGESVLSEGESPIVLLFPIARSRILGGSGGLEGLEPLPISVFGDEVSSSGDRARLCPRARWIYDINIKHVDRCTY